MQGGVHRTPAMDRVIYGTAFDSGLSDEVERLGASRVFVLASGTLARETNALDRVRAALGSRLAGTCTRIGPHTPRPDVVAAANAAREAKADLLVTLGGGSVTDAAKMVGLCLGNEVTEPAQLDRFVIAIETDGRASRPPVAPPGLRSVAIPTTLSAGEYTSGAGCTDTARHVKQSFAHPLMMPRSVILDPALTRHTPEWLFLSTGMRAVDHAVETLCSAQAQPFPDGTSLHALRLLGRGLRGVKADPENVEARSDCQLGAWMSIMGPQDGVPMGASHAIGHVLGGTAGVPHGYTSCVMLPVVLRFNAAVTGERQRWVAEALGRPGQPAADAVSALIADLGLPARLRDVGVKAEQLDKIAALSLHDHWLHTNPRPVEGAATVRALLDEAW